MPRIASTNQVRYHGFRPELRRTVAEVELPRPTALFPLATKMTVAKGAIADVLLASRLLMTADES